MGTPGWRCIACGCSLAEADERRARLGMRGVNLRSTRCIPDCGYADSRGWALSLRVVREVREAALADPDGARAALTRWARKKSSSRR